MLREQRQTLDTMVISGLVSYFQIKPHDSAQELCKVSESKPVLFDKILGPFNSDVISTVLWSLN